MCRFGFTCPSERVRDCKATKWAYHLSTKSLVLAKHGISSLRFITWLRGGLSALCSRSPRQYATLIRWFLDFWRSLSLEGYTITSGMHAWNGIQSYPRFSLLLIISIASTSIEETLLWTKSRSHARPGTDQRNPQWVYSGSRRIRLTSLVLISIRSLRITRR